VSVHFGVAPSCLLLCAALRTCLGLYDPAVHSLKRWNLEKAGAENVSRVAISLVRLLYFHTDNDYIIQHSLNDSKIGSSDSISNFW
jgi:hypothetical protein